MRSSVVVEEHVWFLILDFSSLQSDNFWNTISWKCSLKDDCIRSSLIECQSFLNRKFNINPKYRVLMFLPCTMQVLCTTWYIEVNLCRILMPFVSGINRQKEYCLSLAWILTSRYQSIVDDRMKIKSTSNMVNMLEESTLNYHGISVQYWYLLFAPPPAAKHIFQRSSDQYCTCGNGFWR